MIKLATENAPTPFMTELLANEFMGLRSSYAYPKAYLARVSQGNHDIKIAPDCYANFSTSEANETTNLKLDAYHHQLLHSEKSVDRVLGLASVIYWGFYTFGENYAKNRVDWHIHGHNGSAATTPERAMEKTNATAQLLSRQDMGAALGALNGISQLNRTPFASKVIAFMAPSAAGVYDNRIADGLDRESWASHMKGGIGQSNSPSIQKSYQAWCSFVTLLASQLNLGIALGKEWHWSCGEDKQQLWRALDVERAIFAKFGNSGSVSNPSLI